MVVSSVTGSRGWSRQLSAQWIRQLLYDRGVQVPEGVTRPFIADTVSGNVTRLLQPPRELSVMPSYSTGARRLRRPSTVRQLVSPTRIDVALDRHWAIYVEHFYYNYRFATPADLPRLLAAGLNRQGVRSGWRCGRR